MRTATRIPGFPPLRRGPLTPLICHIAPKGNRANQLVVKSLSLGGKISTRDRIASEFAVTRPHEELACRPENPPEGDEDIHQALETGSTGHLIKGMPLEVFMEALRKVHAGRWAPHPRA